MRLVSGQLLVVAVCLFAGYLVQGCEEGELIKASKSCDEYDECINGLLVRKRCKLGQYFDGKKCDDFWNVKCMKEECVEGMIYERGTCANSYDVCFEGRLHREICPPLYLYNGEYCVPMETCQDTRKCTDGDVLNIVGPSYMECINGEYVNKLCNPGYIYEKYTKTCQPIGINLKSSLTFCNESDRRPLPDCSQYEECVRGRYQTKDCPKNMLFDKDYLMCRFKYEATCADISCENGMKTPDLKDCSSYNDCSDGTTSHETCSWPYYYFDPVYQQCTYAKNCARDKCTGDWIQVSNDCKQYTMCKNGYAITYSCSWYQRVKNGECRNGFTCEQPNVFLSLKKEQCINNQTRRVYGRCTEYEKCVNKKWKVMRCPKGLNFQTDQCEDKPCPLKPVLNHCSQFMQPESEKKYDCPFGYLFDSIDRQCVHTAAARCAQGECVINEIINHPTDCTKYKVCKNGKWEIQYCTWPFSHFDINKKECKFWKYTCGYDTVNCTSNAVKPDQSNCKEYEKCLDDSWRTNKCWFWQHFDSVSNSCATFKYKCYDQNKQEPQPVKQAKTSQLVLQKKYDTLTDSQVIADSKCTEGERKLVENTCRWYTECVNGEYVSKRCSPCKNFNPASADGCDWVWKKPCAPGTTDPPFVTTTTKKPAPPPECKESDKRGIKGDCSRYQECQNGKWVNKKCSVWGKFDIDSKSCCYFSKAHCA